jgi:hypothetical protein
MFTGSLDPLQIRVLRILSGMEPRWTLTGGGALAGVFTGHRTTRDLDLFWHGPTLLGDLPDRVGRLLADAGLDVEQLQVAPAFHRLKVSDLKDVVVVDLVADPTPVSDPPVQATIADFVLQVDSRQEILVNKLCALLGRMEPRDLSDVRALVESGADLALAVQQAPSKDAGFSAITLAWVLRSFPVTTVAAAAGWSADQALGLQQYRDELVDFLARRAFPNT